VVESTAWMNQPLCTSSGQRLSFEDRPKLVRAGASNCDPGASTPKVLDEDATAAHHARRPIDLGASHAPQPDVAGFWVGIFVLTDRRLRRITRVAEAVIRPSRHTTTESPHQCVASFPVPAAGSTASVPSPTTSSPILRTCHWPERSSRGEVPRRGALRLVATFAARGPSRA
jgi:hypothetical protein